jgi:hypothetical protein
VYIGTSAHQNVRAILINKTCVQPSPFSYTFMKMIRYIQAGWGVRHRVRLQHVHLRRDRLLRPLHVKKSGPQRGQTPANDGLCRWERGAFGFSPTFLYLGSILCSHECSFVPGFNFTWVRTNSSKWWTMPVRKRRHWFLAYFFVPGHVVCTWVGFDVPPNIALYLGWILCTPEYSFLPVFDFMNPRMLLCTWVWHFVARFLPRLKIL